MKWNKRFSPYAFSLILSLSIVLFYVLVLSKTPFFLASQYKTGDTLFRYQANFEKRHARPQQVVVIGVDDESMRRLDRAWPWSREIFAAFLERIRSLNPKVIGFDFSFVGKSQNEEADLWFADEIAKNGNVILASYFDRDSVTSAYAYIPPGEIFSKVAKASGFINVPYDQDDVTRRSRMLLELADKRGFAYNLSAQLACAYLNLRIEECVQMRGRNVVFRLPSKKNQAVFENYSVPLDRKYHIPISFRYPQGKIQYIPFWKIITGQVEKRSIEGKIVLVGALSPIMHDVHTTPIGRMPGVFINANKVLMILNGDFVKKVWPYHHWIFLMALAAVFTLIFYRLRYLESLITLPLAEFVVYASAIWLFIAQRLIFSVFSTMLVLILVHLIVLFYKGLRTFFENMALQRQVVMDALTGLYGHNYISLHLGKEFERHRRFDDKEFCFVMIDIDWFKKINDTYGHEQGNVVLVQTAKLLRSGVRSGDVAARYGGEEFCLILFDCNVEMARQTTERINRSVEATIFTSPQGNFNVTISAGICSNKVRGLEKAEDLIRKADEALYQAKFSGRNRVSAYTASTAAP